ncbi:hypothetical protein QNI19_10935 [Cytophagaceae bacterium DM2B3-1]|uniref:Secreted protein n=1 Tax=Xanthocytophaga flava TaxID=3048013 RepID=A0ABT7CK93_9BACT|nr:hypothetical protein [Xanthocytophaga flavus]MDJ1468552.1 hypothetical protein [Xanthocytophaga flavus]MDJ1493447.1 hypothetical protein [Xanthocytophaga flavus]
MKPVKVYSQLALLCLLLMSMGFPSVIAEDDTGSDKTKSVRYVKVGFLACTRQVSQVEDTQKIQETKCVNKIDKEEDDKIINNNPPKISQKVGASVETVSQHIEQWLKH